MGPHVVTAACLIVNAEKQLRLNPRARPFREHDPLSAVKQQKNKT